ncbi:MAG: hypothetical protein EBS38_08250, partial [Actinobacteria bacterium]|nr:hypothetical protein [Actinomycetota bacterium]
NRLLEKSATAVANWRVRTFDSEEKETDTWVIRDRTEAEARREAESDPTVQDSHDWTMTAAEIEESAVTESEEEKSRLSTMMSSTGLVRVDVGEGNDRYWATGETGKTRNVSVGTVQRACRRLFPDREFRVNRRGTNIHCILWKVKEDAAKDAKKAKAKKIDESDVRERMLDDGYEPNGVSWMSPRTGEILSFEQAREEYLNTQSLLRNGWVDEERGWCSPDGVCMTFEEVDTWASTSWTDTVDGKKITFTIKDLLNLIKDKPPQEIETKILEPYALHSTKKDEQTLANIEKANLDYPIIVLHHPNKPKRYSILDGNHRLQKAINNKLPTIKAKVIELRDMPEDWQKILS